MAKIKTQLEKDIDKSMRFYYFFAVVIFIVIVLFIGDRIINYSYPVGKKSDEGINLVETAIIEQKKIEVIYSGKRYKLDAKQSVRTDKSYSEFYLLRPLTGEGAGITIPPRDLSEAYIFEGKEWKYVPIARKEVEKSIGVIVKHGFKSIAR